MNLKPTFTLWFVTAVAMVACPGVVISQPVEKLSVDETILFQEEVPNALDPAFIFGNNDNSYHRSLGNNDYGGDSDYNGEDYNVKEYNDEDYSDDGWGDNLEIQVKKGTTQTGIRNPNGEKLTTNIYGYSERGGIATWPGKTILAKSKRELRVKWSNGLPVNKPYLLTNLDGDTSVIDESLHWAYSLPEFMGYSIEDDGTPIVTHLHGGHTDSEYDGFPESLIIPRSKQTYLYDNSQPAGTLWYHDHALGMTRLNVYGGMAGFYILRDKIDTGDYDNSLGLPAYPYEAALAIQDRYFKTNGDFYRPAFKGQPGYDVIDENVEGGLPPDDFPDGGPTVLTEFFGDRTYHVDCFGCRAIVSANLTTVLAFFLHPQICWSTARCGPR